MRNRTIKKLRNVANRSFVATAIARLGLFLYRMFLENPDDTFWGDLFGWVLFIISNIALLIYVGLLYMIINKYVDNLIDDEIEDAEILDEHLLK